jgi:hypothetical protein
MSYRGYESAILTASAAQPPVTCGNGESDLFRGLTPLAQRLVPVRAWGRKRQHIVAVEAGTRWRKRYLLMMVILMVVAVLVGHRAFRGQTIPANT